MSREPSHPLAGFGQHPGLGLLQRQRDLEAGRPPMAASAKLCGELGGIDLVAAADADLRQPRTGFFEEDGELLAADRVELVDRAVGLIGRRPTVAQRSLADRSPDEPITELEMQPLQDSALHLQRTGGTALEEAWGHYAPGRAELDQLGGLARRVWR